MKATIDISKLVKEARDPTLRAAEEALVAARKAVDDASAAARATCTHPFVVAYPYYHSDYGSSMEPYRICATCGFREGGWGCGYYALANADNKVIADSETREYNLATEPQRISGWWIIPNGETEPCDPYRGYHDVRTHC